MDSQDALALDAEISVSSLRGQDPADCTQQLEHVLEVVKRRAAWLADTGQPRWPGPTTTVTIVPSSEVLNEPRSGDVLQVLARLSRVTGVTLRLLDAIPPLPYRTDAEVWPVSCYGSAMVREMADDPAVYTVSYHQLSGSELMMLAELV